MRWAYEISAITEGVRIPTLQEFILIWASFFIMMLEDVMPVPCLSERGGGQQVADSSQEPPVNSGSKVTYGCNGCMKIYANPPVRCDGICCSNCKFIAGLKRRRLERYHTDLSDERILSLVANHANWNPFLLSVMSCLCRKTRAISDRHLWREFCLSRAPKMVSDLLVGAKNRQIDGGWRALGKLFLYCAGCGQSDLGSQFPMQAVAGHFVPQTRFSRTSGRFFLIPRCRGDVLYVSDPCEHENIPEDVGLFRGVFRSFDKSETKKLLTFKRVPISEEERCPFCKAGVWSMSQARMIPKSASIRLAAYNENVDYFVCLNGHVNGKCALLPLSESDRSDEDE